MSELGAGSGSGYPGAIDTTTTEANDPGGTVVDADKVNDLADAILKIQAELGVDPAGTLATVLAYLGVEHKTTGKHSDVTADSLVLAGKIDTVKASDLASASEVAIGAANGLILDITGTTQIDQFDDVTAGIMRIIRFDGILTWVHSATKTVLPGAANITTAVGDIGIVVSDGATNAWRCVSYMRADGSAVIKTSMVLLEEQDASASATIDFTTGIDSTYKKYIVEITGVQPASNGEVLQLLYEESSTFQTSLYLWNNQATAGGTWNGTGSGSDSTIDLSDSGATVGPGDQTNELGFWTIEIADPASSNITLMKTSFSYNAAGGNNLISGHGSGFRVSLTAVTGFRFKYNSGNIAVGNFKLYGIR